MTDSSGNYLLFTQNADGGWPYAAGQASTVEPTCAVLMALRDETGGAASEARARGLAWLRQAQHGDGGWGFSAADAESGWQTAWALLALEHEGEGDGARARGANWLLGTILPELTAQELKEAREKLSIDGGLYGWPWRRGEASWVEPTALSMLALITVPQTATIQARLDMATRYLVDRRCGEGGWNFGNPVMLGAALPPRAYPTAWALLSLAGSARAAIRTGDAQALRNDMDRDGGALALAWGLLALRALGEDDTGAAGRLAGQQSPDGGWNGNPYHTAVALMAQRGNL
jgi:Squalene-hopene cyclase C-terminal domain/Prenyltransferase and squalene oxidase repeat